MQITATWSITSNPSANAAASATRAASPGVVHVLNGIQASLNAGSTAPAAVQVGVVVRDGAAGVGPVIWATQLALQAVAGASSPPISLSGLAITGSPGNAMTLEFTGAAGLNTFETVAGTGFDLT